MIGIGNGLRGDDGAPLEVARRLAGGELPPALRVLAHDGEALELIELWAGADAVLLIDAVRSDASPGTTHRIDVSSTPLPTSLRQTAGHSAGVADVIELARALGMLPATAIVFGIEGADFRPGARPGESVWRGIDALTEIVRREAVALAG